VVTARSGTVALRRAGTEEFVDIADDGAKVYAGDQIRATGDSSAVLTLADETVVELAEDTTVAIGDRDATADPASSAVVMAGVARFTVSERGEGEGPFLVFTSAGIIGTKGTTYAVAVAATGEVRVGVEEGEVEVAGGASLDEPVAVAAGNSTVITAEGSVGGSIEFALDDWGAWRDEAEASGTAAALAEVHLAALEVLEADIEGGYDDVEVLTEAVVEAEAPVIAAEEADDGAAYEEAAPEIGATVEASYMASTRLQYLTYAMLSRAYIANELYLRYPDEVKPVYEPARPRVVGAILYHKKYHEVVHVHVRPWRNKYYYHHPRGRVAAVALGVEVPTFYKKRKLKKLKDGAARGKFKVKVYKAPKVRKHNKKKKVWVKAPGKDWSVKVKVKPRKARGKAGWYVKVKTPKAKTWKVKVKGKGKVTIKAKKPTKRGGTKVRIGVKKPGKKGKKVGVKIGGKGGVKVKTKGGKSVKVKTNDKGGAKVKVKGKKGGKAGVKVKGGVKGGVKIKKGGK
jgi:hypothetical protein